MKSPVIKVTVDHVCISKTYDPDCRIKFKATADKVVCSTKGFRPDITVEPKGKQFTASVQEPTRSSFKLRVVSAKTPAKAFAKAVRQFWAN